MERIYLGCIADDFTGAADAASFLAKGGLKTLLYNGIPKERIRSGDCQAIVIALKTRTAETADAVRESCAAVMWLREQGARQFYFKYCSTFDSKRHGNIGPVIDAVMSVLSVSQTLICPALPVNGRTVKNGRIYVHGIPLEESPMKNHPLTPMWDSAISVLMQEQGRHKCMVLTREELRQGEAYIRKQIAANAGKGDAVYLVPDCENDEDAARIINLFGNERLLTGGSGILEAYAKAVKGETVLLLAGSCSEMTLKQIQMFGNAGYHSVKLPVAKIGRGELSPDDVFAMIRQWVEKPVLVYSSDTASAVAASQKSAVSGDISEAIETFMAQLAILCYEHGCRRFVVAGGETSGAVTKALGFQNYRIEESVAPGVPILKPLEDEETCLILKSGNFGAEDFFIQAVRHLNLKGSFDDG